MNPWVDLYAGHGKARIVAPAWTSEVRRKLIALAEAGHCDSTIRARFTKQSNGALSEWSIRAQRAQVAEPLTNLPGLATAQLTVLALEGKNGYLHQFTVMIGFEPAPWLQVRAALKKATS